MNVPCGWSKLYPLISLIKRIFAHINRKGRKWNELVLTKESDIVYCQLFGEMAIKYQRFIVDVFNRITAHIFYLMILYLSSPLNSQHCQSNCLCMLHFTYQSSHLVCPKTEKTLILTCDACEFVTYLDQQNVKWKFVKFQIWIYKPFVKWVLKSEAVNGIGSGPSQLWPTVCARPTTEIKEIGFPYWGYICPIIAGKTSKEPVDIVVTENYVNIHYISLKLTYTRLILLGFVMVILSYNCPSKIEDTQMNK